MFKERITSTPFTTEPGESFFSPLIPFAQYSNDVSFISSIRALVYPRLKENERLDMSFSFSTNGNPTATNLTAVNIASVMGLSIDYFREREYSLKIHNFSHYEENVNETWIDKVNEVFEDEFPGWKRIPKVSDFYRGAKFNVSCFINPELKSTIVFVCSMDIRRMHLLQTGIKVFCPWFFVDSEISDDETHLVGSLTSTKTSKDEYVKWINRLADAYDFRTMFIRSSLKGFESIQEQRACDNMEERIRGLINDINRYNNSIASLLGQKRDLEIKVLGLKTKITQSKESDSELMQYFLDTDCLYLKKVDGLSIEFYVKNWLSFFPEDQTEDLIDDDYSYIYNPHGESRNHIIPVEDMRKLLTAIFIDRTLKVQMCGFYRFDATGNVSVFSDHFYGDEFNDCIPNPHLQIHSCLGGNSSTINARLLEGDYIGAVAQCIQATGSLNTMETVTMQPFMTWLYGERSYGINGNRCIGLPTGEIVTPKEAIEYLKKEENNG